MKERLTGAIILVVLIVLLVPELLSGPKGPAATPPAAGAASPSSEEPPLQSYTINLGDDSHSRAETANGAAGASGPPQPSGPAQPTTQAATPDKDVTESSSWDTTDAKAAQAAPEQSPPVQTAPPPQAETPPPSPPPKSASEPKPASPTPKPTHTATVASKANQPPPPAAARAETPKPVPADKPHEAPAAGQASGGWAVQLGVFASKENADRLALDVRTKGFKAIVSPVTSGKRKLYRVRVGPAADKSAAQDLQSKLKAAGRPGGTVVPYS